MAVEEFIRNKLKTDGPMPFHDYMDIALYHPGEGYYTRSSEMIGESGDFYTMPYMTSLFGDMIAKQLEEMWCVLGKGPFTIIEYGAGIGTLCNHILRRLKQNEVLYNDLQYGIIEKNSTNHPGRSFAAHEKVTWYESIDEMPPLTGCILSNELIDNFPVHLVQMQEKLMEIFVAHDGTYTELLQPASGALCRFLTDMNIRLPYGFKTEINLMAEEWIKRNAQKLEKGFILTIDYGFLSSELYDASRSRGTLKCIYRHQVNDNPYENIGRQDITAHVNFSALAQWGNQYGFKTTGYTNQSFFFRGLGITSHIKSLENEPAFRELDDSRKAYLLNTLLIDMGKKIKVLVQHKGVDYPNLSGMRFAQTAIC